MDTSEELMLGTEEISLVYWIISAVSPGLANLGDLSHQKEDGVNRTRGEGLKNNNTSKRLGLGHTL